MSDEQRWIDEKLTKLEKQLKEMENGSEEVKNESETLKRESEKMKNESKALKRGTEEVKNESETLKKASEEMKNESETLKKGSKEMRKETEKLEKECEKLKKETKKQKDESSEVAELVRKNEAKISSLWNTLIDKRFEVLRKRRVLYRNTSVGCQSGIPGNQNEIISDQVNITQRGHILGDISAIRLLGSSSPDVAEYKEDFFQAYGMSFEEAVLSTPLFPSQVLQLLNIRASIRDMPGWDRAEAQAKKETIDRLVNEMMEMVLGTNADKREALFEEDGALVEKYGEVVRLFTIRD